jgi:uncharacterized protein (TIGR03089 family)
MLDEADLVVCGPDGVDTFADVAARMPVVALSLRPLGARFATALPPGVVDYGAVVLGQPDSIVPYDPPAGGDVGWVDGAGQRTQAELIARAVETSVGGRLLTDVNPCTAAGLATLVAPLATGGGTVWVRNPDESGWSRRYDAERATAELRA